MIPLWRPALASSGRCKVGTASSGRGHLVGMAGARKHGRQSCRPRAMAVVRLTEDELCLAQRGASPVLWNAGRGRAVNIVTKSFTDHPDGATTLDGKTDILFDTMGFNAIGARAAVELCGVDRVVFVTALVRSRGRQARGHVKFLIERRRRISFQLRQPLDLRRVERGFTLVGCYHIRRLIPNQEGF